MLLSFWHPYFPYIIVTNILKYILLLPKIFILVYIFEFFLRDVACLNSLASGEANSFYFPQFLQIFLIFFHRY